MYEWSSIWYCGFSGAFGTFLMVRVFGQKYSSLVIGCVLGIFFAWLNMNYLNQSYPHPGIDLRESVLEEYMQRANRQLIQSTEDFIYNDE